MGALFEIGRLAVRGLERLKCYTADMENQRSRPERGDPHGRRLARNNALLLAEASRVVRSLEVLLLRAGVDPALCKELGDLIVNREQAELQRSYGYVEPRKRFKRNASQPLLERRPTGGLYLDENGKSNPEPHLDSPQFFSLGGIAMSVEAEEAYIREADRIKRDFFGTTEITFHEPEMRQKKGVYYFENDEGKQSAFDDAIRQLVITSDCKAFGAGIRKTAFQKEFVEAEGDPYLPTDVYSVAILMLLERYVDFLANDGVKRMGRITFESQGPKEDALHQLEYARILVEGTQWVPDTAFRNWLETGLRFIPKSASNPCELADMISRDIYEWVREDCKQYPGRWDLFSRKIYWRGDGRMGKFGVKVFPDADIKETIDLHRDQSMGADN